MSHSMIEHIPLSDKVIVSVVIPHYYRFRNDNLKGLLEDLKAQSVKEMEIIVVHGVSPQGKAINAGVGRSKGEILVIMDDDTRTGHSRVIERLVQVLKDDSSIGMAGASVVIPEKANPFQKAASRQFPRFNMAVVQQVTDSDLPGHPCAAFPKEVFIKIGMERDYILRGLDPDLRVRIRRAGYRVVLAPEAWIYHPLPESLSKFIQVFLRNGYGSAYLQSVHPDINYDTDEALESTGFSVKHSFLYRILRYPFRLIHSLLTFQWIRFLGYTVYVAGYLGGLIHCAIRRSPNLTGR